MSRQKRLTAKKRHYYKDCAQVKAPFAWLPGKRFFLIALLSVILVLSILGWKYIADVENFPVGEVEIVAPFKFVSQEEIQVVLDGYWSYSFLMLPTKKMRLALEALPWVEEVTIGRFLPDKVLLSIVEKKPVAQWNDDGFFSDKGELILLQESFDGGALPRLSGASEKSETVFTMYELMQGLFNASEFSVKELVLTNTDSWQLRLNNGIILLIGRGDIEEKIRRFIMAYPQLLAGKIEQVAYVDLRYSNGLAVRFLEA